MNRVYKYIFFICLIPFLFLFYSKHYITYEKSTASRALYHEVRKNENIYVALVWPQEGANHFTKGAKIAQEIINEEKLISYQTDNKKSYTLKLNLDIFSEKNLQDGLDNAKDIARNPIYSAVVGHNGSSIAIPASITYEFNGITYISPVATSNLLTQHNFNYVFRSAPRDTDFADALIAFCHEKKYQQIAVIYCRDTYGINFSNIFVESAAGLNKEGIPIYEPLQIITQKSYADDQKIFLNLIAEVGEMKPDCIFIAGLLPQAGELIKQIRQMGITQPIISGDGLDSSEIIETTGSFGGELYIASVFDSAISYKEGSFYQKAKKRFIKTYSESPDYDASQGFESIYILAQAYRLCQSSHPLTITSFLKVFEQFEGVTGHISFSKEGDIIGKPVFIKQLTDSGFNRVFK